MLFFTHLFGCSSVIRISCRGRLSNCTDNSSVASAVARTNLSNDATAIINNINKVIRFVIAASSLTVTADRNPLRAPVHQTRTQTQTDSFFSYISKYY